MLIHRLGNLAARRWPQLALAAGFVGMGALAFCLGRNSAVSSAQAQPAKPATAPVVQTGQPTLAERWREPVARIYGNVAITHGELAEYIFEREASERLPFLVNKRIIEIEAQRRGIQVTDAEVEKAISEDMDSLKVSQADFENKVLKRYNKSLYEWREDVVRPKILLERICRDKVQIAEEDYKKAYESYYGDRLDCRIIMWPHSEKERVMKEIYPKIRDSEKEFDEAAKHQIHPRLAANGGRPDQLLRRYTLGDEEVEKEAFKLSDGEISRVMDTKEGVVVIKAIKHVPPETRPELSTVRAELLAVIKQKKLDLEIATAFNELRKSAAPEFYIKHRVTDEELKTTAEREISPEGAHNLTSRPK